MKQAVRTKGKKKGNMMQARAAAAILALLPLLAHAGDARIANQDLIWENISGKPTMPSDPKTVSPCTVWYNNDGTVDCESVLFQTSTNRASFLKWVFLLFSNFFA